MTTERLYLDKTYSDETNLVWTPPSNIVNLRIGTHSAAWCAEVFAENLGQGDGALSRRHANRL